MDNPIKQYYRAVSRQMEQEIAAKIATKDKLTIRERKFIQVKKRDRPNHLRTLAEEDRKKFPLAPGHFFDLSKPMVAALIKYECDKCHKVLYVDVVIQDGMNLQDVSKNYWLTSESCHINNVENPKNGLTSGYSICVGKFSPKSLFREVVEPLYEVNHVRKNLTEIKPKSRKSKLQQLIDYEEGHNVTKTVSGKSGRGT